jgi:aspartyl-tRNA(Asn)/glutamyl-tRNA(Gln) amidotransferase subunit B
MRSKEDAHDYRYFPDPDLPPLVISEERIAEIRANLPELPEPRRARLVKDLGISEADARVLTEERELADWFEAAAKAHGDGKKVANWVQTELLRELHRAGRSILESPISPHALADLLKLIDDGTISGKIAKEVFAKMFATGDPPKVIVEREGLVQVTDVAAIEAAAREVIAKNPKQAADFRAHGATKPNLIGFFVGQVMKATQGKANPQAVNEILRKLLTREDS